MLQFSKFVSCTTRAVGVVAALVGNVTEIVAQSDAISVDHSNPLLRLVSAEQSQVRFSNTVPENERINILTFEYFHNGGGVAIGDVDNNGLPDIYFTGNIVPNHLYLNQGNLKFQEVARSSGVQGSEGWDTGVSMIDINNDGWLDIYVCRSGQLPAELRKNQFFINQGATEHQVPTFIDQASMLGLDDPGFATQAAFLDYDRDGDLDMFLLNHNVLPVENFNPTEIRQKIDPYVGDKLFENIGSANEPKFKDVSQKAGLIQNPLGYGLGVGVGDLNNDGWPDIYVSNDFIEHDYLYYNQQDGTFVEQLKSTMPHTSQFSMGNDLADYNNDGWLDIMVADMVAEDNYRNKTMMRGMDRSKFHYAVEDGFHYQYMTNTLQLNNGVLHSSAGETKIPFSEASHLAGVASTDWSWAPLWLDLDNDGYKDLNVTNGYKKEVSNKDYVNFEKQQFSQVDQPIQTDLGQLMRTLLDSIPSTKIANYAFRNNGDLTFSKQGEAWNFTTPAFSNGASYADLDNDGDLDVVISNIDDEAFVYENQTNGSAHYLKIKLSGPVANRDGIGARVTAFVSGTQQMQEQSLTRGFQSSVDKTIHFGLGTATVIDSLFIRWPDGLVQKVSGVKADQTLLLDHAQALTRQNATTPAKYLFTDLTNQIGITIKHQENAFDDFERESLLPHKMSNLGPALAVADVNGDGLDDFFVGGAKGYAGRLYRQTIEGSFRLLPVSAFSVHQASEDVDALFFDADQDGDQDLYVVSGGNDYPAEDPRLQDRLYLNDGRGGYTFRAEALPTMLSSGGVVASADMDGDGDSDLFVGGRQVPGQYPVSPRSYLLENQGDGQFVDVSETLGKPATSVGMVAAALWNDLDQDGDADLLLAGEWTGIQLLLNELNTERPGFRDVSQLAGLANTSGWWFSLASADVDYDGDTDLVAGNLGLNYKYTASLQSPFEIFYGDFDLNSTQDIVLGYYNDATLFPLRGRECSAEQMPFIKEKFPTYASFGQATLAQVYGSAQLDHALHYQAKTFATSLLINQGTDKHGIPQFEVTRLPFEAQLSSVNAIILEDFNEDENIDIVLAGNFYASEVETPRNDASVGLLLFGDGAGGFQPMPAFKSGLQLDGDVKKLHWLTLARQGERLLVCAKNQGTLQFVKTPLGRGSFSSR